MKRPALIFVLGLFNLAVSAQNVEIWMTVVGVPGNGFSGSCIDKHTVSGTLTNSSGTRIGGFGGGSTQTYSGHEERIYSGTLQNGWQGKVSGSGSLTFTNGCASPQSGTVENRTVTYDATQPCQVFEFRNPEWEQNSSYSGYKLTVRITIYSPINTPVASEIKCGDESVSLTFNDPLSRFDWYYSSDSDFENETKFRTDASSSITASRGEFTQIANQYKEFYIRVKSHSHSGCYDRRTSGIARIKFRPAPATITSVTVNNPSCIDASDGSISINFQKQNNLINHYVVDLIDKDVGIEVDDKEASGPSSSYQVIFSGLSTNQLKQKQYAVQVLNNTNVGEYGACASAEMPTPMMNPDSVRISFTKTLPLCPGASNGKLVAVPTGGTGSYSTYQWSGKSTETSATVNNASSGSYAVLVKDSKGCSSKLMSTVLDDPMPILPEFNVTDQGGGFQISCHGRNDGIFTVSATGGAGDYQYKLNGGNFTSSNEFSALSAGKYKVTVKDKNSCEVEDSIELNAPNEIDFEIYESESIHCPGKSTGELTVRNVSNVVGSPTYKWSTGEETLVISEKQEGSYTLTISDNNGCSRSETYHLSDPGFHTVTVSATTPIACNGNANGVLSATTRNSSGQTVSPSAFEWFRNDTVLSASVNPLTNCRSSTYRVTVTFNIDCEVTSEPFFLSEPELIIPEIEILSNYNGEHIRCHGDTNAELVASATGGTVSEINGVPQYSYSWNTNPSTTGEHIFVGAGTYTVTVEDDNGCTGSATTTLTQPEAIMPKIEIKSGIACKGRHGTLEASATGGTFRTNNGIPSYQYLWSNNSSSNLYTAQAGFHMVTVTDDNGCSKTTAIELEEPEELKVEIQQNFRHYGRVISCPGEDDGEMTAVATGGTTLPSQPYRFSWTGPSTSSTFKVEGGAGTYSVTVTDANNCPASASAVLQDPPQITASIAITSEISCHGGNDGVLAISAKSGTPPYTYEWQGSNNKTHTLTAKAGKYTALVKDVNNCPVSVEKTLEDPRSISPLIKITTSFNGFPNQCNGDAKIGLEATRTGGVNPVSYKWSTGDTTSSIGGQKAGTYSVEITDAKSCKEATSITVIDPPALQVSIAPDTSYNGRDITCFGKSDAILRVSAAGGAKRYSYEWENNTNLRDSIRSNLPAGTYSVRATDRNNCSATGTYIVTPPNALSTEVKILSSYNGQHIRCTNSKDGKLEATATGGTQPYSYKWNSGQTTQTLNDVGAGLHVVVVEDANKCVVQESISVLNPEPVIADVTILSDYHGKPISCYGAANGSIKASASGGTGSFSFLWNTGQTSSQIDHLTEGSYIVKASDENGCWDNADVYLDDPEEVAVKIKILSNYNGFALSCKGSTNGHLGTTVTGGTGPFSYKWNTGEETHELINIGANTYSITVVDTNMCSAVDAVVLEDPEKVSASIFVKTDYHGFPISCYDSLDAVLEGRATGGTGNYFYSWNGGDTTTSLLDNVGAGYYDLMVIDQNGCRDSTVLTINEPEPITASVSIVSDYHGSAISCNGADDAILHVNAVGGTYNYRYNWSRGDVSPSISQVAAGTHVVHVEDENACYVDVQTEISQPDPVIIEIADIADYNGFGISCFESSNGMIKLKSTGGTGTHNYLLNDSINVQTTIENLAAGSYNISVNDLNGCTDSIQTVITSPDKFEIATIGLKDVLCFGGADGVFELEVNGGLHPFQSRLDVDTTWYPNRTVFDSLRSDSYRIIAKDLNGCTDTASVSIGSPPKISATFHNTKAICNDSFGISSVSVSGGTGSFAYRWTDMTDNFLGEEETLTNLKPGVYKVLLTDAHHCEVLEYTAITGIDGPQLIFEAVRNPSCFNGSDGNAAVEISSGTAPFSILWSTGDTSSVVSNLKGGEYSVSVTDAHGCQAGGVLRLTDPLRLSLQIAEMKPVSCNGLSDGMLKVAASGGVGDYDYRWEDQVGPKAEALPAGDHVVQVIDSNGCSAASTFSVSEPPPLSFRLRRKNDPSCYKSCDGEVNFSVSGGNGSYRFNWNTGEQTPGISGVCAGNYILSVTDALGCEIDTTIQLSQPDSLQLQLEQAVDPRCFDKCDGSLQVKAVGGSGQYSFLWDSGNIYPIATSLCSGSYHVSVQDSKNCFAENTFFIDAPDEIVIAETTLEEPTCHGFCDGFIEILPSGGSGGFRYNWSTGSRSTIARSLCAGNYAVRIMDSKNCKADRTYTIEHPDAIVTELVRTSLSACSGECDGEIEIASRGGTGDISYQWVSGSTTSVASDLCPGTHRVFIKDQNNCTIVEEYAVEKFSSVEVELKEMKEPACFQGCDGSLEVKSQGGNGQYSYAWSTGGNEAKADLLCAGEYFVSVEDGTGCRTSKSFTLEQPDRLQIEAQNLTAPSCYQKCDGSLEVVASGGTSPYSYLWNSGHAGNSASSLCSGSYWISAADKNGCSITNLFSLAQPAAVTIQLDTLVIPSCNGAADGVLEVSGTGGTAPYSYQWDNGERTRRITQLPARTYGVGVTDAVGCVAHSAVVMDQPDSIRIKSSQIRSTTCNGICDGEIDLFITGGSGVFEVTWENGTGDLVKTDACAGENRVSIIDSNDCMATSALIVPEPEPLSIELETEVLPSCHGDCDGSLTLQGRGGTAPYSLTSNLGVHSNTMYNLCAGEHAVVLNDANGCAVSQSFQLTDRTKLVIDLGGSKVLCEGQTYVLDAGGPWHASEWYGDHGFQSLDSAVILALPGSYWVTVTNDRGCMASDTFLLESPEGLLSADFIMASEAMVGDTVVIADVSWPASSQSYYTFPEELTILSQTPDMVEGTFDSLGVYSVTLTAVIGDCSESVSKSITILQSISEPNEARLGYEKFVKSIQLFSNPNNGSFDFSIEFAEESEIMLTIWALPSGHMHGTLRDHGSATYSKHVDLRPLPSGHYVLRVDHKKGKEYVRFIVY